MFNGLFGISKYIVKPNSVGKERYAQLCHEVLKVMFDSGFQPVKVYCPAADSAGVRGSDAVGKGTRRLRRLEDGNLMIRHYRCGGREAHLLFDNVLNLAQERNTIPPDVPNNAFYRAQVNPALRFPMDYLTADALSAQMRWLRKSCEGTMTDLSAGTVVGKGQEGYCRCQAQMVVTGGVPAFEIASIEAKFSRDALIALEKRYPSYSKLQANCLQ